MDFATYTILILFGATYIGIIGFGVYSLHIGSKSIFIGSGIPAEMAKMLLSSIHITSQILLGVLVITIIILLIVEKAISSESGLPVLSVISGYLLSKNFKDISFIAGQDQKQKA